MTKTGSSRSYARRRLHCCARAAAVPGGAGRACGPRLEVSAERRLNREIIGQLP